MSKRKNMNYLELIYKGLDDRNGIKYSNFNRHTEINTDREIKICTKCDKVYEVYALGGGNYEQFNYIDFPRYGKQKEKCAECRKLDGEKIFFTWNRGHRTTLPISRFRARYKKQDLRFKKTKRS